ncbi:MAG: V-type ATP synthase subunit D [Candidatus Omnitrophica bacterium]|nr:V-type ATP synthase subunit D [Candidatus Omnitrophota bacterium]
MAKVKFTKGELKRQRDALRQYERYLPTLQLKKQQLQMEIMHQAALLEEKTRLFEAKKKSVMSWSGLLSEAPEAFRSWTEATQVLTQKKNIAGLDIGLFEHAQFPTADYDLFTTPLWVDNGIEAARGLVALAEEIRLIKKGVQLLHVELRITNQRVNLFEKVKIPEAKETIRLIKIYIGDQMTNAVGRCKIAKRKLEDVALEEALV